MGQPAGRRLLRLVPPVLTQKAAVSLVNLGQHVSFDYQRAHRDKIVPQSTLRAAPSMVLTIWIAALQQRLGMS